MAKAHGAGIQLSEGQRLITPARLIEEELAAAQAAQQDGSLPLSIRQAAECRGSAAGRARSARTVRWNRLLDDLKFLEHLSMSILPCCEPVGMAPMNDGCRSARASEFDIFQKDQSIAPFA